MEVTLPDTADETSMDIDIDTATAGCRFPRRHSIKSKKLCAKEERNASIKRVSLILQKSEEQRTLEEAQMLQQCSEAVEEVQLRWKKRDEAKRRLEEFEEPMETLHEKCQILARAIAQSQHLVVYTGAGISTAARIPDYRGSNGIWTRLQQGKDIGNHDLSLAEPTYTHMALSQLYHQNILKYVVSQNCDGLHLRSGLPRNALSELHGNMYIEVCKSCKPAREYWRLFDVTENTARYSHKTMRRCYVCNEPLVDTIVHFGERGTLQWPLNWSGASKNARKATTILCLGSSLKVLKRYPWLWQMDKPAKKRPNLYIVNLQWTPKDDCANIKIHGRCDVVMKIVMDFLGISVTAYDRVRDPIFHHATHLCDEEVHTTTQPVLKCNDVSDKENERKHEKCPENSNCDSSPSVQISDQTVSSKLHSSEPQLQSVSLDCDIVCNTHDSINNSKFSHNENSNYLNKTHNGDPGEAVVSSKEQQFNNKKCSFSIDSILHSDTKKVNENVILEDNDIKKENHFSGIYKDVEINSNFLNTGLILPQNYHAFLAYYHFSDAIVLQNPLLSYQDMLYYPYQTSFLYSGFHSIINPLPLLNSNFNNFKLTASDAKLMDNNKITKHNNESINRVNPDVYPCKFCSAEFKSVSCLFYIKTDPVFLKPECQLVKTEKKSPVCLCCDYSTDEDDETNTKKEKSINTVDLNDTTAIKSVDEKNEVEGNDKEQIKVKIQAGWFGKGYRKIKRPRKR